MKTRRSIGLGAILVPLLVATLAGGCVAVPRVAAPVREEPRAESEVSEQLAEGIAIIRWTRWTRTGERAGRCRPRAYSIAEPQPCPIPQRTVPDGESPLRTRPTDAAANDGGVASVRAK